MAGNKCDLSPAHREVSIEDVSEWLYCELPKLRAKVIECSAKDDFNIKEVFRCFVTLSRIVTNPCCQPDDNNLKRRSSAHGSRRFVQTFIKLNNLILRPLQTKLKLKEKIFQINSTYVFQSHENSIIRQLKPG